ncbi:MAG: DNA polymerase IV [Methylococcales bacterium]|nr:DNA polymerase IV [Methylococcales bacterium]MBT7408720.1 DNA polymerase IV [Methylococcales bacterium]
MNFLSSRKIIHIDMDAFYASVEQRDFPEYRGKPLVVGGKPNSRGVVATCSYEARQYGIHSAMSCAKAHQCCPHAIFVPPRFTAYKQVSQQIHAVFRNHTTRIEPLSLDEAYLDVTSIDSATKLAKSIKREILKQTGIVASAGVSYNKFLAKIASDYRKPDGLFVVTPAQGTQFAETLPVGKFYGIGKVTEAKMNKLNIFTGADLKKYSKIALQQYFGKMGLVYYQMARGIDNREVVSHRTRKSLGSETTFATDIGNIEAIQKYLQALSSEVAESLKQKDLLARTITIKVKYANFEQVTRSQTFKEPINEQQVMMWGARELLKQTEVSVRKIRLIGIKASNLVSTMVFNEQPRQLSLFSLQIPVD